MLFLLVLVAGGGVGFFLVRNDTASRADEQPGGIPTSVAAASIVNLKIKQVTPTTIGPPGQVDGPSEAAAKGVERALSQFYEQAFIVKSNWDQANYAPAWASFLPESRAAAARDENLLTLGKDAPSTYSQVGFDNGDVSVQVLLDGNSQPKSAIASVHFNATAKETSGSTMAVRSVGRYFLQPEGDTWSIYGYQVRRKDKQQ